MKNTLAPFALGIAVLTFVFVLLHPNPSGTAQKETAYERVIRTKTLRCGYALWPGGEEMDPNTKQLKGIVPDFTNQIAEKLGLKIEWVVEVQWGQQVEALRSGKIDAICSADGPWVYSEASFVDYTDPAMYYVPIYIYGRRDETRFKNLNDANNPNISFSTIDGDISLAIVLEKFPKARRLEVSQSGDVSILMANVVTNKADLVICDPLTINAANAANRNKLRPLFDQPVAVIGATFSVPKGEPELLQMLNQGFALMQQLGTSDAILDRYDPRHELMLRPEKHWNFASNRRS